MITRLLVGILTPAMRAIRPISILATPRHAKPRAAGLRLDVRWRPALVENSERTQKIPRARRWRRDPERLRDDRDVERYWRLSSEKLGASVPPAEILGLRLGRLPISTGAASF